MNGKRISFSALVTAVIGLVIGLALAAIAGQRYVSSAYRDLPLKLALSGAALGAAIGAGQEVVRELKQHQEEDQAKASFFHQHHSE
ncbi:MAG: hypothetical protein VKO01_01825 [Cyanobacteriota bacterium]|jgi:hypothetical protein|nr:hypothetical protein [Cyanobacteriota bacterium]